MAIAQMQTTAREEHVRASIESVLTAQGARTVENAPGRLVMDLGGSVKAAYLAGGFRGKLKMPMRIVVSTVGGPGGTGLTLDVHSRGTGSGVASGGWLGAVKQDKAEKIWLQMALDAVAQVSGGPPPDVAPPAMGASPPPPTQPPPAQPPPAQPPG
jgi:hypothetical protein